MAPWSWRCASWWRLPGSEGNLQQRGSGFGRPPLRSAPNRSRLDVAGRSAKEDIVALLVGALLAFAVGLFATATGLDRDRAFYPTVTIVIASYYSLFAAMGSSTNALVLESVVGVAFVVVAAAGFRSSLWLVVVALAAHGVFDLVHGRVMSNPGVPAWWPGFCLTYDVAAASYLAWSLKSGRIRAVI